jgi:transcriptional regulator with XRE-family HTH domain
MVRRYDNHVAAPGNAVGARIREAREASGMTRSAFARSVRVTPAAVWNWETNGAVPRPAIVPAISQALGVSEEFLLGEEIDSRTYGNKVLSKRSTPPPAPRTVNLPQLASAHLQQVIEKAKKDIAAAATAAGLRPSRIEIVIHH